ncbi:acyltransferase [Streptomyces sp. TBY4]|uniref:acyltransferase family protein n=1 Tax=Streptomyces sp. TBY4 TaxID=2962030 RepID=UPI0020B7A2B5|nr:acyltransferase [Streptomyces sp. TBY4]MCP3760669.1 acyltransferase [Streptomyces sp. TBY4]
MARPVDQELAPPPLKNVRSLTGLRFLMSMTVFISHLAVVMPVPYVNDVLNLAGSGGTFFLVLSGFALTWSFRGNDTAGWFLGRRMARIWPTLVIALALPLGFAVAAPGTDVGHMVGAAVASLFFVQAWIPGVVLESTNPVTWMLSCVVFFYMIFLWVGRFALRRSPRQLAWLAVLTLAYGWVIRVALWVAYPPSEPLSLEHATGLTFGVYSPLGRIHEFLIGVLIAAAMRRGWRVPLSVGQVYAVMAGALGVLWLLSDSSMRSAVPHDPLDLVMAPIYACLLAAYTQLEVDGRTSLYSRPALVALGKTSMGIYLFHFTVIFTVAAMVYPEKSMVDFFLDPVTPVNAHWLWGAVSLVVSLGIGWLVHRFYEDPIERRLRGLLSARSSHRNGSATAGPQTRKEEEELVR